MRQINLYRKTEFYVQANAFSFDAVLIGVVGTSGS
jgi:hypothetical protein